MRLVSPLLKRGVYPVLQRVNCIGRNSLADHCAVVNYHGVLPAGYQVDDFLDANLASSETLRRQLRSLRSHYNVISPAQFRAWIEHGEAIPSRSILITCDDGLLNNMSEMVPILEEVGVGCLFFVIGASCGTDAVTLWYEELYLLMRKAHVQGVKIQLSGTVASPSATLSLRVRWWEVVRQLSSLGHATRESWIETLRREVGPAEELSFEHR